MYKVIRVNGTEFFNSKKDIMQYFEPNIAGLDKQKIDDYFNVDCRSLCQIKNYLINYFDTTLVQDVAKV